MTIENQDFELWAGEDKTLNGTVYQSDGTTAQNITGCTIAWVLKTGPNALTNTLSKSGVIVSAALGTYTITILDTDTTALAGTYWHKATLTDASANITVIMEGWATFNPTKNYATLGQLKDRLGIATTDTADDSVLIGVLNAISREIEKDCYGRRFYTTSADETRYYTASRSDRLLCPDDILSITTMATDSDGDRTYEDTWAVTDYDLTPYNAALDGEPYTGIEVTPDGDYSFPRGVAKGVKIVGKFGYSQVAPWEIQQACLLRAAEGWAMTNAPLGVSGSSEVGTASMTPSVYARYKSLLAPFRRLRA